MKVLLKKLLILIFATLSTQNLIPLKKYPETPSEMLIEFPDYKLIFHHDNFTKNLISLFFLNNSMRYSQFLLFNYETQREQLNLTRPLGHKFLHIVALKNLFLFEEFTDFRFNLEYMDIVLFVIKKDWQPSLNISDDYTRISKVWNQKGLQKCGCVFIYNFQSTKFYYVHHFVGKSTGVLQKIETLDKIPKFLNYLNDFKNFNGHVFQVAYSPFKPFIWCSKKVNQKSGEVECEANGIDGKILRELSNRLNFKYILRKVNLKPGGGLWKMMIEDVHFGRRDWAVGGISRSLERIQLADFTTMLHMENYVAFYMIPGTKSQGWKGIFKPFQLVLWLFLMLLLFLIVSLLWLSQKIEAYRQTVSLQVPFRVVIDQSTPHLNPRQLTTALLLSVWFLTSIILTTAYKSKLAATMIKPIVWEPKTVIDLYDSGYSFQVNTEDWTVLRESLENSLDTQYRNLLGRSRDDLQFCEALGKVLESTEKVAILDEETATPYIIFNTCKEIYGSHELSRFRVIKRPIAQNLHAWPLQLGAPYRETFSQMIRILISAGIIEHWYKSWSHGLMIRNNFDKIDSRPNALSREHIIGPMVIWFFGVSCAFIVFICENLCKKVCRN